MAGNDFGFKKDEVVSKAFDCHNHKQIARSSSSAQAQLARGDRD
jgi:hypothetical protein